MKLKNRIYVSLLLSLILTNCTFYTFKDGSTKYEEVKTIRIKQFSNNSGNGPSDLAATFTEKTKDYYLQNGKFELVDINEDLLLECDIKSYKTGISGATSGGTSAQNKLTITVSAEFIDTQLEENNLTKSYSRFEVYDRNTDLSSIESDLIDIISEQIVTDIFNATTMKNEW